MNPRDTDLKEIQRIILEKDGNAVEKTGTKYFVTEAGTAWTAPVVEAA